MMDHIQRIQLLERGDEGGTDNTEEMIGGILEISNIYKQSAEKGEQH